MQFSYFIHDFPDVHLNESLRPKKGENSGIQCTVNLGLLFPIQGPKKNISGMIQVPNKGISGIIQVISV